MVRSAGTARLSSVFATALLLAQPVRAQTIAPVDAREAVRFDNVVRASAQAGYSMPLVVGHGVPGAFQHERLTHVVLGHRYEQVAAPGEPADDLRVGTFQSAGARLLPEIIRRFTATWPAVDLVLEELDDEEIEVALERGELDVGFVSMPVADAPLETIELIRDPYVLVVPAVSPLATGPIPSLEEIAAEPLIGFRFDRPLEPVAAAIHGAGVEPTFAFRSNDNPTVQALVAAGIGNAIMPQLTVDAEDRRVVVRELRDAVPPRRIAIARHRDRYHSPAARAFVETALGVVGRAVPTRP